MTTHETQPEPVQTVDPMMDRGDRVAAAEPMREPVPAENPMTTHETQPEHGQTVDPMDRGDRVEAAEPIREPVPAENPVTTETAETPIEPASVGTSEPVQTPQPPADLDTAGTDRMLFAHGELSDLQARWTEVQAAFVDDPRDCVQKADGLVADVVEMLTTGFGQARAQLEEQWARGEEVSTEDLRVALRRYRDFFERLLAV